MIQTSEEIFKRELENNKRLLESELKIKDVKKSKDLTCFHCGKGIINQYYECYFHKTIFCQDCTFKQGDLRSEDFPKCHQEKLRKFECIWNLNYIGEKS